MDLEAAKLANERTARFTLASMIACFLTAGVMLIASLAVAKSPDASMFPMTTQTIPR